MPDNAIEMTLLEALLNAHPGPILAVDHEYRIHFVNEAAQTFFKTSSTAMIDNRLDDFLPPHNPLFNLLDHFKHHRSPVNEQRVDFISPRIGQQKSVNVFAGPVTGTDLVLITLQPRSLIDKMDRQLTHRTAARSATGLAAMLAHEIKNPLSGVKGAAQLLRPSLSDEDQSLADLIINETNRIATLVDKMEVFTDERVPELEEVNIHSILKHVKQLAEAGFCAAIPIVEDYDPSLPLVLANRDQLIQVLLNLVKNAAEALDCHPTPQIILKTSYKPGFKINRVDTKERVDLPLEILIEDNGCGVPADIMQDLFDPFVSTKINGMGLGLAMVAKTIRDHGGIVECDSEESCTQFRILLPTISKAATGI